MAPKQKMLFLLILYLIIPQYSALLSRIDKTYLLEEHNLARRRIMIANTRLMEWHEGLAELAEEAAKTCSNALVDKSSLSSAIDNKYSWVGENRHVLSSATLINQGSLREVLRCWVDGINCQTNTTAREQLLYPDSYLVGCGANYFSATDRCHAIGVGVVLVCFYAPGFVPGISPTVGEPCSHCPMDAPHCVTGLCSSSQDIVDTVPADPTESTDTTTPYVWYITPNYGSYAGGTLVSLIGRGFSKDQFNRDNPLLGNTVTFTNGVFNITCAVESYYTSTDKIACRTGPLPLSQRVSSDFQLIVTVDGKEVTTELGGKTCGGTCTFRYRSWATPTVTDVSPHAGIPGVTLANVSLSGYIITYKTSDTQVEIDFASTFYDQTIERMLVGGELCNPWTENENSTYGGEVSTTGSGRVSCLPETNRIDSMNATIFLSRLGRSMTPLTSYSVDNKLRQYLFQTHSDITGVEPNTGSPEGGTLITVYGKNLYDPLGDVKVYISGVPCRVVNYTSETIQCITGPAPPTSSVYPGARGIVREIVTNYYTSINQIEQAPYRYPNTSYNWTVQERAYRNSWNYPSEFGESTLFTQRYTGFFVPPLDSYYTFNLISDDGARLYLSPNMSREHKELVAYISYSFSWDRFSTQRSEPIYLKAGQSYYIESVHRQRNGAWWIGFGAKVHNLSWTSDTALADHEEQLIYIQSVIVKETQEIAIKCSPKIQVITLDVDSSDSSEDLRYQLSFSGNVTRELTSSDTEQSVTSSLNELWTIQAIGSVLVKVNTTTDDTIILSIVFISAVDNLPDVEVFNHTGYFSNILQAYQKPLTFSLKFDSSRETDPLPVDASANNVSTEILNLFTTTCDVSGAGSVFFKDSYDNDLSHPYGTVVNGREPYCGRNSIYRPTYIWRYNNIRDERTGQVVGSLTVTSFGYRHVCFAYYGTIPNSRIRVYVLGNNTRNNAWYYINFDASITNEWTYVCVDLYQTIHSLLRATSQSYVVRLIRFQSTSNDFWIDEVMITTSVPTVTQLIRAVRPNGVFISDVTVTENFTSPQLICNDNNNPLSCDIISMHYTVSYTALHCGYNIPLISSSQPNVCVSRVLAGTPPVTGTLDLTFNGQTIYNISADVTGSGMEALLQEHLPAEGTFEVTPTESCSAPSWNVKWAKGGDLPLMTVDYSRLSGHMVTANVSTVVNGGVWIRPFRADMLRLPELNPQVQVSINGIPASCHNRNCTFTFTEDNTPQIIAVSPPTGGQDGSPVYIYGNNLATDTSKLTALFGNTTCNVSYANETLVICTPVPHTAGPTRVSVHIDGIGYASTPVIDSDIFTYDVIIDSVTPDTGSVFGGNKVTITGMGFPTMMSVFPNSRHFHVLIDSNPCFITSSSLTEITCISQPHSADTVNVTVVVNGVSDEMEDSYTYSNNSTLTISSVSPPSGPVRGGTQLTIIGSNFVNDITVNIGGSVCNISSFTATEIQCTTAMHQPGVYDIIVTSSTLGRAVYSSALSLTDTLTDAALSLTELMNGTIRPPNVFMFPQFTYLFSVTNIVPCSGSLLGGTKISIKGSGFDSNTMIMTGNGTSMFCEVTSRTDTSIECVTKSTRREYIITNNGTHPILGNYFSWNPNVLEIQLGDTVTWMWDGSKFTQPFQFEVHQSTSLTNTNNVMGGFRSMPSVTGSFSYTFTNPGIYYYATDVANICQSCVMSGTIAVKPLQDIVTELSVTTGQFDATYNVTANSSIMMSNENCTSCQQLINSRSIGARPLFVHGTCDTPTIDRINSPAPTVYSNITLTGSGLGMNLCDIEIQLGTYSCLPVVLYNNMVTCIINATSQPPPNTPLPLTVLVHNTGYALLTNSHPIHRSITISPVITSISPPAGSVLGANVVTISGAALMSPNVTVMFGARLCMIQSVSYYTIKCTVPKSIDTTVNSTVNITVTYGTTDAVCTTDCVYQYLLSHTPLVTDISPMEVGSVDATVVTLSGELLDSNAMVMVGPIGCTNVTKIDMENITCLLQPVQAGEYPISVLVPEYGQAMIDTDDTIESLLRIDGISPKAGSIRGGTSLSITGIGFSQFLSNNTITIQNSPCIPIHSNYSEVTCMTPDINGEGNFSIYLNVVPLNSTRSRRNTVEQPSVIFEYDIDATPQITSISPMFGQQGDQVTITGQKLAGNPVVTIGGSICTVSYSNDTTIMCSLGAHYVGQHTVDVIIPDKGRANGNVQFMYTLSLFSVSPQQSSFAGQNVLTISGIGFNPVATFIRICGEVCPPSTTQPTLTSVQCIVPSFTHLLNDTLTCNVSVTSLTVTETLPASYTFSKNLTPYVTSINRTRGGTAGGSVIQLNGSGFTSSVTVTIAETECSIVSYNDTTIVCVTGASGRTIKAPVQVYVQGKGFAVSDSIEFYYVDLWSSMYTWGGTSLPVEGDFIIIPAGQTLVLDIATPVLKILLIQGGELIFEDEKDGVELHSENVLIVDGGKLQVGTEDEPYQHKAQIVMYGNVLSTEIPLFGAKTLAVRNGTLDIHGKPIMNTWTRLAETIQAGMTVLHVQHNVSDWEVGGQIVLASTSYSRRENEQLTIASISNDGKYITVSTPVKYTHISTSQTIHGRVIETRGEVGYLTRNVVVRGNRNEEWDQFFENCEDDFDPDQHAIQTCFNGRFGAETVGDQFGSQIMLHRGPNDNVVGRIEYAEVTHAGQAFRLGRYPIHFHLNGDVNGSYVRGCGIHHTFNRAVTIHGVDNLLVEKNVAFDVLGHAYFLEDGIEQDNIIQYNLGVFVRASSSLLNVDITPATFWAVNPKNTIRHNAAAGGTHFGFWYRLPVNPTGPSSTTSVRPINLPLTEFYNNTAHSFGWYGIWIFPSYYPVDDNTCNSVAPAIFDNFLSWRNNRGIEFSEVGAVQIKNSVMLDNIVAGVEYTNVRSAWGKNGSLVENVLIVGHSDLHLQDNIGNDICSEAGLKTPHSNYLTVSNVTFVNFDRENCYALRACSHCRNQQGGFETRFEKLTLDNSPNVAFWMWEHEQVFRDMDGTLTGIVGGALLPSTTILPSSSCSHHERSFGESVNGSICDNTVKFGRFALTGAIPSSLSKRNLTITNSYGTTILEFVLKRLILGPGYMAILPLFETYQLDWSEGERFTNISYRSGYYGLTSSDYLWIKHDFNKSVDVITVNNQMKNASTTIPPAGSSLLGDYFVNSNETSVTYYVNGSSPDCAVDTEVTFSSYQCFYKGCIPPPPPEPVTPLPPGRPNVTQLWSNASTWPNASIPMPYSDVYIECSLYILVDVPLPPINVLTVCGGLEFLDDRDHFLEAHCIVITGGRLVAGNELNPFQHQLTILLNGDLSSPEYRLPNLGPVLGAKGLGVFGELSLHGRERYPTWTTLSTTATYGDTQLYLNQPVDWVAGEEIVVASSFFESLQTEEFTIVSISSDKLTLIVDKTISFTHLGGIQNIGSYPVNISAEVGLLSRNIKILGTHPNASVDTADQQSYGCRVLVSTYFDNGNMYTGLARLSGVEFKGCGQEGFVESIDPRYSLAFLNTGEVVDNSSYIKSCSFHKGYSTGIGVYGTNGLAITNNVVHRTVGPSFYITGNRHTIINNAAFLALFPGTYRGRNEPFHSEWTSNFELAQANDFELIGNSAAGGAKSGFHVKGENCLIDGFVPKWRDNVAHSTLHGVHVGYGDDFTSGGRSATQGCSAFHRFTIYSCYHFGFFTYSRAGARLTDSLLVNNYAATFVAVIGPPALSHIRGEKTVTIQDTVIVSSIDSVNCTEYSQRPEIAFHRTSHTGIQSLENGHVGVILTSFQSGSGGFPRYPWKNIHNYPSIAGLTELRNITFTGFTTRCSTMKEVALMTHPKSEDAQHPVTLENIKYLNGDMKSKFYNHKPLLNKVNPSDCVDMDCDGLKKILIRDVDGSFTGSTGLNTLISHSEFEWGGDPRRGLGDYRIPKTMLATPTGSKIDPDVLYPNKGIYRGPNGTCQWEPEWNSYHCMNIDHLMLIIESLDADTEVRRLSPIGIGADGYIDLVNGPQDNGWCGGYTCQERISTFYTLVATGLNYTIALTSTNPQQTHLILLNANESQYLSVAVIYTNPQRLDIYVNNTYIIPTNGYMDSDGNLRYTRGDNFVPSLSQPHGTNYYNRTEKKLYIIIKGSTPIRIETTPVIQLGIDLPPVTVDEFFEVNLINNLALLLNIPPNRIRIVNVVSEGGSRRRRAEGRTRVEIEIGNAPSTSIAVNDTTTDQNDTDIYNNATNTVEGNNNVVYNELVNITTRVAEVIQTGELAEGINQTVFGADLTEPAPPVTDPTGGIRATNETGGPQPGDNSTANLTTYSERQLMEEEAEANASQPITLSIPTMLSITAIPTDGIEGTRLSTIHVVMLDAQGMIVSNLGVGLPWRLTTSIMSSSTNGAFLTNSTVEMGTGVAMFNETAISHPGTYRLQFKVTYPQNVNFVVNSTSTITVSRRSLYLSVIKQPVAVSNASFPISHTVSVQINDVSTNDIVSDLGWRNRQWYMSATVLSSVTESVYGSSISVPIVEGIADFTGTYIRAPGTYKFRFMVYTVPSTPSDELPASVDSNTFEIKQLPISRYIATYNNSYDDIVRGYENNFVKQFTDFVETKYSNIRVFNVSVTEGSIIVSFFATSEAVVNLLAFTKNVNSTGSLSFSFRNTPLLLVSVEQDPDYLLPTAEGPDLTYLIVTVVCVSGSGILLLLIILVTLFIFCYHCFNKRGKYNMEQGRASNIYELSTCTIHTNKPLFENDEDYPAFHLVSNDKQIGIGVSDAESLKKAEGAIEHVSSNEVKVGGVANTAVNDNIDDVKDEKLLLEHSSDTNAYTVL